MLKKISLYSYSIIVLFNVYPLYATPLDEAKGTQEIVKSLVPNTLGFFSKIGTLTLISSTWQPMFDFLFPGQKKVTQAEMIDYVNQVAYTLRKEFTEAINQSKLDIEIERIKKQINELKEKYQFINKYLHGEARYKNFKNLSISLEAFKNAMYPEIKNNQILGYDNKEKVLMIFGIAILHIAITGELFQKSIVYEPENRMQVRFHYYRVMQQYYQFLYLNLNEMINLITNHQKLVPENVVIKSGFNATANYNRLNNGDYIRSEFKVEMNEQYKSFRTIYIPLRLTTEGKYNGEATELFFAKIKNYRPVNQLRINQIERTPEFQEYKNHFLFRMNLDYDYKIRRFQMINKELDQWIKYAQAISVWSISSMIMQPEFFWFPDFSEIDLQLAKSEPLPLQGNWIEIWKTYFKNLSIIEEKARYQKRLGTYRTWETMDSISQICWGKMGWNKDSWNKNLEEQQIPHPQKFSWNELSDNQQECAKNLGYNNYYWNKKISLNDWHQKNWSTMDEKDQLLWKDLGWSSNTWGNLSLKPDVMNMSWNELKSHENEPYITSAIELGFYEFKWNYTLPTHKWFHQRFSEIKKEDQSAWLTLVKDSFYFDASSWDNSDSKEKTELLYSWDEIIINPRFVEATCRLGFNKEKWIALKNETNIQYKSSDLQECSNHRSEFIEKDFRNIRTHTIKKKVQLVHEYEKIEEIKDNSYTENNIYFISRDNELIYKGNNLSSLYRRRTNARYIWENNVISWDNINVNEVFLTKSKQVFAWSHSTKKLYTVKGYGSRLMELIAEEISIENVHEIEGYILFFTKEGTIFTYNTHEYQSNIIEFSKLDKETQKKLFNFL